MTWLDFVLLSLATWRLSSLITHEDGPFSMFEWIRRKAGVVHGRELTGLATLFSCVWCMSIWIGAALLPLAILGDVGRVLLAVPAASTLAIVIERWARA